MTILFKIASRGRPDKFKETVMNIVNNVSPKCSFGIVASADLDDETMYNDDIHKFCNRAGVILNYGKHKTKIEAINAHLDTFKDWDILVNVSDDQRFLVYHFDKIIVRDMQTNFPDLDGVLHYPDKHNKEVMTMSVIGLKYFQRDNYIYFNEYYSTHCDLEAREVAIIRKKYAPLEEVIYTHEHPNNTGENLDATYTRNMQYEPYDEKTFLRRKKVYFNLDF